MVINVIDNGIKYSCGGDKIQVNSHVANDKYHIEVINNSNPIPDEIFNNIFESFIKSNDSITKDSRGLGLYLCSEIIKEHEGQITMENGSVIKIKISLKVMGSGGNVKNE